MASRTGKRKRVVVEGLFGEQITDVVEGPRNPPIRIGSWEEYVKHFGGLATPDVLQQVRAYFNEGTIIDEENIVDSPRAREAIVRIGQRSGMSYGAAVAAAYQAYLLHCKEDSMGKRERTIGDMVRAADEQGRKLDFRFVPLTAAEKRKGSKRLEAEVFGPVLEQLGLLSEDEMQKIKSKTTKRDLIEELTFARKEIAQLRRTVEELEREEPLEVRVSKAARLIAEQFGRSAAKRCPKDTEAQQRENTNAVEGVLRRVARGYRLLVVVAEHGMMDGPGEVTSVVAGVLGDLLADQGLCRIVDNTRETNARQVVMTHGAADSLAMSRRLGAKDRLVPGEPRTL